MPRIMTITMEVSDQEVGNLLQRINERGGESATISDVTNVTNTTTTPAPPSGEQLLDDHGVQWDARYHATTKTKKANGAWKAAKGMDAATKAAAEAYENSFKNAVPVAETPAPPAAPSAPVVPSAPTPPSIPAAPTPPAPVSFEELTAGFGEVIAVIGQPALMEKLGAIYADAGVDSEGSSLQTNETQRAQVLAAIKALIV